MAEHFVFLAVFISCVDPGASGLPVLFGSFGKKCMALQVTRVVLTRPSA